MENIYEVAGTMAALQCCGSTPDFVRFQGDTCVFINHIKGSSLIFCRFQSLHIPALAMRRFSLLLCLFSLLAARPFQRSSCSESSEKEKTLAMIKPDGLFGNYTDEIKQVILSSGFSILGEMMAQLDKGNVTLFYAEHSGKSFFPSLIKYMTSGPVFVMVLEKVNAISEWRYLIGPTDAQKAKVSHPASIRALCGVDSEKNCVHGSDSSLSAAREIKFFFGEMLTGDFFSTINTAPIRNAQISFCIRRSSWCQTRRTLDGDWRECIGLGVLWSSFSEEKFRIY